jgi:hypothetical protein
MVVLPLEWIGGGVPQRHFNLSLDDFYNLIGLK